MAGLAFLLFLRPVPVFSQSRLWEANLARPGDFLPLEMRIGEDTSAIPYPQGEWSAWYSSFSAWSGLLRREGGAFAEIASAQAGQTLWVKPWSRMSLGLAWSGRMDRNRYVDSGRIDARLGETRESLGLFWIQHILPGGPGESYLDLAVALPDARRQMFSWMLAGGKRGAWHAEYSLAHGEAEEEVAVVNLDSGGNGEEMRGVYLARMSAHRVLLRAPAAGGRFSLSAAYGEGRPRRPRGEFWFCDSSRRFDGALSYARPWAWGEWRAGASFRESEAITLGRRIPEGSEGLKRFHFARNHGLLWGVEGGREPRAGETGGLRLGLAYREFAWTSTPASDALDARSETLSYNRLGLSFIANLYGGLYKVGEIIQGDARAESWEGFGEWRSRAAGNWTGAAGISLYRTGLALEAEGNTLSQRFLAVDTSAAYGRNYRGYLVGVTPRLLVGWGFGRFRLELGAAQIVPLVIRLRGPGGSGIGESSGSRYPLFRNGFSARAGLQAGYQGL